MARQLIACLLEQLLYSGRVKFLTGEEIIENKERRGLQWQFLFRMVISVFYLGATLVTGTGKAIEIGPVGGIVSVFLAISFISFRAVQRGANSFRLQILGVIMDGFFITGLTLILHQVMGIEDTPFSFVLKSDIYPLTILFLIFHMVNFRPALVLFSGFFLFFLNLGFLLVSIITSPLPFTDDFGIGFTSYRINPEFELGKLILFLIIFGIAFSVTVRVRNTIHEAAKAEVSSQQLRRFFSPGISDSIVNGSITGVDVGGRIQNVAILFSDIKNFTALSEDMAPDKVLSFLEEYHRAMVETIFDHGGTLDKFIGDAIMATFGTPEPSQDDAFRATEAGIAMNEALGTLNEKRIERGEFPIQHRIGIHYGSVLAGNIGSEHRLEYTVIGDAVNTASRIESACKVLHREILVSEDIRNIAGELFHYEDMGRLRLKGKKKTIRVYYVKRKNIAEKAS